MEAEEAAEAIDEHILKRHEQILKMQLTNEVQRWMEAGEPAPAPTQASSSSTEPAPAPAVGKAAYRQTEAEEAAGHQLRLVGGWRGVMMMLMSSWASAQPGWGWERG